MTSRTAPSAWRRRAAASVAGVLLGGAALLLVVGQLGGLSGQAPAQLGVRDGLLAPPTLSDNSVSSQADRWPDHPRRAQAQIAPLVMASGPAGAAAAASGAEQVAAPLAPLTQLLQTWPGASLVEQRADYLHASFSSRWLRFVDDAEFWWDPAEGVVHLRSASRLGASDLGVNRRRIEAIRKALAAG